LSKDKIRPTPRFPFLEKYSIHLSLFLLFNLSIQITGVGG
jgi:hypothetical protein